MNHDETFERNARAWLDIGPSQAPSRVVAAALHTTETTPQARTFGVPRRRRIMITQARLAMAVAVAVVMFALGGGYLLLRYNQSQVAVPVPTPSPTATMNPSVPSALIETKWLPLGSSRPAPGAGLGLIDAMVISETNVRLPVWYQDVNSRWSFIDQTTLEVTLDSPQLDLAHDRWPCTTGDIGKYSSGFSADGRTLTLTTLQDECAIRAQIMAGDWSRWPCPNPASRCDPELAAGDHRATFETDPSVSFRPFLNGYSYSVPAGWSGSGTYLDRRNDPLPMHVFVGLSARALSQQSFCPDTLAAGVGNSPTALMSWLATVPGLVTSPAVPISIGGYDGLVVDASVAPGWVTKCPQSSDWTSDGTAIDRFAITLGYDASGSNRLFLSGDSHARYIVLNAGNQDNIVIEVSAPDQASWDDLVAAAMPVIETFQFTPKAN